MKTAICCPIYGPNWASLQFKFTISDDGPSSTSTSTSSFPLVEWTISESGKLGKPYKKPIPYSARVSKTNKSHVFNLRAVEEDHAIGLWE